MKNRNQAGKGSSKNRPQRQGRSGAALAALEAVGGELPIMQLRAAGALILLANVLEDHREKFSLGKEALYDVMQAEGVSILAGDVAQQLSDCLERTQSAINVVVNTARKGGVV